MREIRLRAWDEEKKEMYCSDGYYDNGLYWLSRWIEAHSKDNPFNNKKVDSILMQFTGLKDRNDKEIYEGDIVRLAPLLKGNPTSLCSIKYDGCSFEMFGVDGKIKYVRELFVETISKNVEVIGNIYENPELLNEEKKDTVLVKNAGDER